jgi:FkbM family methyltransferase
MKTAILSAADMRRSTLRRNGQFIESFRTAVKRAPQLHRRLYGFGSRYAIPLLERLMGFRTPAVDPLWLRGQFLLGGHETETRTLIKRLVRRGHTVLDLGAHVGYFTKLLSARVGRFGRVIAFEPHPQTFDLLAGNMSKADNVQLVGKAVGSSRGTATLHDMLCDTTSSSLGRPQQRASWCATHVQGRELSPRLSAGFTPRDYTVEIVTVDEVLSEAGVDCVDFIKMDIEGAELAALRGMAATLTRSRRLAIVVEFNPSTLSLFDCTPQELLEHLRRYEFAIFTIGSVLNPLTPTLEESVIDHLLNQQPGAHLNLLCLRGYEASELR